MRTNTEVPTHNKKEKRKPSLGIMCRPSRCSLFEELRQAAKTEEFLREENARLQAECEKLRMELEHVEGKNRKFRDMLFGSNSQHDPSNQKERKKPASKEDSSEGEITKPSPRPRGAKPGHPGQGRKIPENLEVEELIHDIPEEEAVCSNCGEQYAVSGLAEESFEISMEIRFFLKKHIRKRYFLNCNCKQTPPQLTAPKPVNIIPKGLYDHSFLSFLLFGKYGMQVSLNRLLELFSVNGLIVNNGTIAGIFKKLTDKLYPLYQLLLEQLQDEAVLNIDETGFRHFQYPEAVVIADEQQPEKWKWLGVFSGQKSTVFTVENTRSSQPLEQTLGPEAKMFIVSDGAGAYRKFASQTEVEQARCWAHFRRHFQDSATKFPLLQNWAREWLERIANIYALDARRLNELDPITKARAQETLKQHIDRFYQQMVEESQSDNIHPEVFKVLTSGIKYWDAYTVFVDHPEVGMDNNLAERSLRSGVLGRKNWYGVHSSWSGILAAMMMSFIQTAQQHGLNPMAYLRYVLDTAAKWQGQPRNMAKLLPWNIDAKIMNRYSMKTGCDPP